MKRKNFKKIFAKNVTICQKKSFLYMGGEISHVYAKYILRKGVKTQND